MMNLVASQIAIMVVLLLVQRLCCTTSRGWGRVDNGVGKCGGLSGVDNGVGNGAGVEVGSVVGNGVEDGVGNVVGKRLRCGVGSGKVEMIGGQRKTGSGQWEVGGGEWEVRSWFGMRVWGCGCTYNECGCKCKWDL